MASARSVFLVQIEQEMPEYRTFAKINNDRKKGVEPAGANQDLIKPVLGIPVDIVDVVQMGQADLVQIQRVDIRPYVRNRVGRSGDVRHRLRKASLELVFLESARDDHHPF